MVMGVILASFAGPNGYSDLAWGLGFLHVALLGLISRFIFCRLIADTTA
jgi:hypothetical protein